MIRQLSNRQTTTDLVKDSGSETESKPEPCVQWVHDAELGNPVLLDHLLTTDTDTRRHLGDKMAE